MRILRDQADHLGVSVPTLARSYLMRLLCELERCPVENIESPPGAPNSFN